jgi:hypothetical protein
VLSLELRLEIKKMTEEKDISTNKAKEANTLKGGGFAHFVKFFDVMGENSLRQILVSAPFLLFLLLLAFLHIANNHYADQIVRNVTKAEKDLKAYRWEYLTVSSKLTKATRQSELAKRMKENGVEELRQVPKVLTIENKSK